jgi:hypothetical protein
MVHGVLRTVPLSPRVTASARLYSTQASLHAAEAALAVETIILNSIEISPGTLIEMGRQLANCAGINRVDARIKQVHAPSGTKSMSRGLNRLELNQDFAPPQIQETRQNRNFSGSNQVAVGVNQDLPPRSL